MAYSVELRCLGAGQWEGGRSEAVEWGGKVLLPGAVLEALVGRPSLPNPLLFRLTNEAAGASTHLGVLEFVSDPGVVVVPSWVAVLLALPPGAPVTVSLAPPLPVGSFARFQPQTGQFLHISNPKAVLENSLRKFACLTTGDVFDIHYNNRDYSIRVEETRPGPAVNIIECDMEVEFSPPLDYEEPADPEPSDQSVAEKPAVFVPFSGEGRRIDGKAPPSNQVPTPPEAPTKKGLPNYDYLPGTIEFFRTPSKKRKYDPQRLSEE